MLPWVFQPQRHYMACSTRICCVRARVTHLQQIVLRKILESRSVLQNAGDRSGAEQKVAVGFDFNSEIHQFLQKLSRSLVHIDANL
jgi:hypothetical protein